MSEVKKSGPFLYTACGDGTAKIWLQDNNTRLKDVELAENLQVVLAFCNSENMQDIIISLNSNSIALREHTLTVIEGFLQGNPDASIQLECPTLNKDVTGITALAKAYPGRFMEAGLYALLQIASIFKQAYDDSAAQADSKSDSKIDAKATAAKK